MASPAIFELCPLTFVEKASTFLCCVDTECFLARALEYFLHRVVKRARVLISRVLISTNLPELAQGLVRWRSPGL